MLFLILALLQPPAPNDGAYEALMLRMRDCAVGDSMVFIFQKGDRAQLGFHVMGGPTKAATILHLSTFMDQYLATSKEILESDSKRLSLDSATIERLELAIKHQVLLIKRNAGQLCTEVDKSGVLMKPEGLPFLEDPLERLGTKSTRVRASGEHFIGATIPINSEGTLYSKILSKTENAALPAPSSGPTQFWTGGFMAKLLSDPAWDKNEQETPR